MSSPIPFSQISTETDLEGLTVTSRNSPKRGHFSYVSLGTAYQQLSTSTLTYTSCSLPLALYHSHSKKYISCLLYLILLTYPHGTIVPTIKELFSNRE